jgi:rhodanese-related sulfurtransferase
MAKSNSVGYVLTVAILLIIAFVVYNVMDQSKSTIPSLRIGIPEARARRFGLTVDVRTPKEREVLGYYPNSIPISVQQIHREVPFLNPNKDIHILIYSNADNRAAMAADILYKLGYVNVRYINESYLSLLPGSSY